MTRMMVTRKSFAGFPKSRSAAVVLLGTALSLSACSYVPDWGNPVVWYDSVFTRSSDAPPKADPAAVRTARVASATQQSESKGFPDLRTVPERAPDTSSSEERRQIAQGLVADRDRARYTDQVLRAGGTPKPPAPPMQVAKAAPATSPQPVAQPAPPPKPVAQPAPAPQRTAPPPAPVQRVAKARLPKLDLQPASREQAAAVPPPPPSAVPGIVTPVRAPRPIVEPRRGSQRRAPYPPLVGSVPNRLATTGAPSIIQSTAGPPAQVAAQPAPRIAPRAVPPLVPVAPAQPAPAPQMAAQVAAIDGGGPGSKRARPGVRSGARPIGQHGDHGAGQYVVRCALRDASDACGYFGSRHRASGLQPSLDCRIRCGVLSHRRIRDIRGGRTKRPHGRVLLQRVFAVEWQGEIRPSRRRRGPQGPWRSPSRRGTRLAPHAQPAGPTPQDSQLQGVARSCHGGGQPIDQTWRRQQCRAGRRRQRPAAGVLRVDAGGRSRKPAGRDLLRVLGGGFRLMRQKVPGSGRARA